MSWELPSLPSPFGFAYETYRHGEPAWDALFVHPEGPFLPTCEDDDWHRGTFKTSRMVYWLSWYLAVDIITVLLCFVAHALPYLLRCCPQNSYRQLAAVDAEELIERGGTSDVAAQKEKTAVEFRDHGAMFEKGGVLDGAFPILHLLYHAFCIAIVCVGWNQDALCLDFGLDWELWAVWQLGMSLSYILQALVRNWSGSMSADPSHLFKFVKPVFLGLMPGMSENVDTMKDWIVTGMCFRMVAENPISPFISGGFAVALIGIDVLSTSVVAGGSLGRVIEHAEIPIATRLPAACIISVLMIFPAAGPAALAQGRVPFATVKWNTCLQDYDLAKEHLWMFAMAGIWLLISIWQFPVWLTATTSLCLVIAGFVFPYMYCAGPLLLPTTKDMWTWYTTTFFFGDAVSLGMLSAYAIAISHLVIYFRPAFTSDLRKSHLSVLSLRQSRQQDGISWTKWFGEKVLTIGQEVTSDARQVIAWNEDWPQGFLGLFFAWHRRDVGGFASFSAALSFAKGLGIPLLRKTLIYVKDFLFELHVQEVTTEIVESCMNVWLEKFQSSHTVDVCAEAAIKLEQLTNKEELRRRFEDFLSEDLVIFKDIKAAAEEACETVIANAASVKLIERVRLRLQETTQAMARELSEQCTSTWTEKLCSPDGTSAIQRHAGAQVDAFTEAEKTLIELTNKERLQKELTKFLYTEHEMFNEIVVIATQACESGIRVEVEESMISMATSKLEATTKNLVTEVCEACMDAWTQKLLPTDEAAHAMFKKMQDKHTVQKTDKLDYTVELEGFPTEKFRTLTNKETLQTKLAAFQDTQSVLFSPISKLARQACETGIKDKSRSSMSDKMRELLAAKATGLLG
eukprot:TRINITY_DN25897_c1_g6_i2.p1 TRINITY_DN25897_c1_g6~~TRINITY_DN25897_c1_g6_i2.p1  ORF type:complete len:855 (+),score=108.88 TRINITY_DN25897_c1_g6_i2:90-2654(+)